MKKLGISAIGIIEKLGIDNGLEHVKHCGFNAIDFGLERFTLNDEIYSNENTFIEYFSLIKEKADSLDLEISQTHGRCETYLPQNTIHNNEVDKLNQLDFKATAILGAPACVVHFPNSTAWGNTSGEIMHEYTTKMFSNLVPVAEKYNVKIALETFGAARVKGARIRDFFADPKEFKRQYDQINTSLKTICLDTGHTHEAESFWVPTPEEMIKILGKDISLLHLHDNTGHWDDHLLPGMGNINWQKVFSALEEIGYNGVYNCELRLDFFGNLLKDALAFYGSYMRKFLDNNGKI